MAHNPKLKKVLPPKRKGWSDKHESYQYSKGASADHSYTGRKFGDRPGWSDKDPSQHQYKDLGGGPEGTKKYKKRKGFSDYGDGSETHRYQDGGIVSSMKIKAKKNALLDLKSRMSELGGDSLFETLDNSSKDEYKDGGVVKASIIAKDKKGLKKGLKKAVEMLGTPRYEDGGIVASSEQNEESNDNFDNLSKEELVELLRNK